MARVARDIRVDLYRTLLMFGICLYHAIGCEWGGDGLINTRIASLIAFATDGFVLISGYYGIKFKPSKIVGLCAIGMYAAAVSGLLGPLILGGRLCDNYVQTCYRIFCEYWFLHAYVFLMLIAPVIDFALEKSNDARTVLSWAAPIFILIYIWSYLATIDLKVLTLPKTDGFSNLSGMTLVGSYLVGRLYRKFNFDRMLDKMHTILLFLALVVISYLRRSVNNSILCVLMAVISFYWVKNWPVKRGGKLLMWMKPSIFSIYLITSNAYGFDALSASRVWLFHHGVPLFATWLVLALAFFAIGFFLDIPRRFFSCCNGSIDNSLSRRIDAVYEQLTMVQPLYGEKNNDSERT